MDSLANTKQTDDPHGASPGLSTQELELVARADDRLAHAYEQIARPDEQLAGVNEQISKPEHDAARHSSDPKKPVNRFRRPSHGRPALRGFIGLLLTACICVAAFASQSYGETAKLMISRWAPQLISASSLPLEKPELAAPAEPAYRSGGCGGCSTFAITTSGSDRAARGGIRPDPTGGDAVAPNDGA